MSARCYFSRRQVLEGEDGPPEDSFNRLADDTAKLRRSMGVEAAVGRRATAGRRSLEAMVVVMVRALWGRV